MDIEQKTIYTITITETRLENTIKRKDWVHNGRDDKTGDQVPEGEYGYAPQVTEVKEVERKIYSQVVSDLDITAVIDTVNKKAM